jgi:hypothetical protein
VFTPTFADAGSYDCDSDAVFEACLQACSSTIPNATGSLEALLDGELALDSGTVTQVDDPL